MTDIEKTRNVLIKHSQHFNFLLSIGTDKKIEYSNMKFPVAFIITGLYLPLFSEDRQSRDMKNT